MTKFCVVTFQVLRSSEVRDLEWWQKTDTPLCPLTVHHDGCIEDAPHPVVQVRYLPHL